MRRSIAGWESRGFNAKREIARSRRGVNGTDAIAARGVRNLAIQQSRFLADCMARLDACLRDGE